MRSLGKTSSGNLVIAGLTAIYLLCDENLRINSISLRVLWWWGTGGHMKHLVSIIFAISAIAVSGPAPAASPHVCLKAGDIDSFHPLPGNHAVILTDGQQDQYKITLSKACSNLHYHVEMSLKSSGSGSCVGHGDYIVTHRTGSPGGRHGTRCMINSVSAYSP
jgi:hypothetical protein